MTTSIILGIIFVVLWFLFNPSSNRIRKIQSLLNKDRSVCDVINSLDGWGIDPINKRGLRIAINPVSMPIYYMYITYKGDMPNNSDLKFLLFELANENSVVTKAHRLNMTVEEYKEIYND